MAEEIRIVTVGTSMISGMFIDAVAQTPGIRVEAVFSRDRARGDAFAAENGVVTVTDDLDAFLRGGGADAVYLGSPNGLHAAQIDQTLAAGVHVFVEKPATPTAAEFDARVDDARARGLVLFEGMRTAYDPGLAAVRDLLPEVGVVRRASFSYCQRSSRYDLVLAGETPNIFDPALAGGSLYDLGVYPLTAMVELFGEPRSVRALSIPISTGADGSGTALLEYSGFIGEVTYSKMSFSNRPSEVQGESGTLEIDHIEAPRQLTLTRRDGSVVRRTVEATENPMTYEVARFVELVSGADAAADQARSAAVLRTVEQIIATRASV